MFCTVPSQQTT
uniref:Uncharacterized protein n=1 Tax=Arundo donax TaxID=35708 RepID=A0A0A8ZWC5_ARUDO